MTSVCVANGPSQARLGFGLAVTVTGATLGVKYANSASWLSAFIASYIGSIGYELFSFCQGEPPAVPTLTAADFVALTQILDPVARIAAQAKLEQWVGSQLWYDFCECVSGGTPAPPAIQPPPANLPTRDPPSVFPVPTVQPCFELGVSGIALPNGLIHNVLGIHDIVFGASSLIYEITHNLVGGGPYGPIDLHVYQYYEGVGTPFDAQTFTVGVGEHRFFDVVIKPNAFQVASEVQTQSLAATTDTIDATERQYCGGARPGPLQPCCPPDAALSGRIDQILQLLTLVQRQIAPFGYVPGAAHPGLTGHGSFAVQGIIGVKIHLSATNLSGGLRDGSPQELFDQGFITLGTADGFEHSVRVDHQDQLVLPIAAGAFTVVGYSLEVGVTATITELRREP